MPNPVVRRVPKIDDLTLHQAFERVVRAVIPNEVEDSKNAKVNHWNYSIGGVVNVASSDIEDVSDWTGKYVVESAVLKVTSAENVPVSVTFSRTIDQGSQKRPSPHYDQFSLIFGEANRVNWDDAGLAAEILTALLADQVPSTAGGDESNLLPQQIVEFGAAHRQMLASLNTQLAELTKKRQEMETEFKAKEDARQLQHEESLQELEAERKKLELESYKARRRSLQTAMTGKSAAERLREYMPAGAKAYSIYVVFVALIASGVGAFFTYQSINQMAINDGDIVRLLSVVREGGADVAKVEAMAESALSTINWYLIVKSVLSSLLTVGGLLYAADWLRKLYLSEVKAAQEADQFNYDILRSNWIIESVLEMENEHGGKVPETWLNSVTTGLFANREGSPSEEDQASTALRALLGLSASAKIGPDGTTMEFGPKGVKKMAAPPK